MLPTLLNSGKTMPCRVLNHAVKQNSSIAPNDAWIIASLPVGIPFIPTITHLAMADKPALNAKTGATL